MRVDRAGRRHVARLRGLGVQLRMRPSASCSCEHHLRPSACARCAASPALDRPRRRRRPSSTQLVSPVGCSTDERLAPALRDLRDLGGGRAGDQAGGGDADRAEHADRGMGAVRDEASGRSTAPPCCGGATSIILGTDFSVDVAEVHQRPGLQADRLDPRLQRRIGVERLAILIAGRADIRGPEHDAGHAVVDQRAGARRRSRRRHCRSAAARRSDEPAVSRNSSGIGAAVPGTPSIARVAVIGRPRRPASGPSRPRPGRY